MKGMDEILKIPGAGEKCLKILVVGEYSIYHIPKGKILFFPQKRIFFDRKTIGFRHLNSAYFQPSLGWARAALWRCWR